MVQPGTVVDQCGNEKDHDTKRQPHDLAPPHFGQVNLFAHIGGAINSHHPKNGQPEDQGNQQPVQAEQFPQYRIHAFERLLIQAGNTSEQVSSIFMLGFTVDDFCCSRFDDFSPIHNDNKVTDMLDDGQVVRNEQIRDPQLLL